MGYGAGLIAALVIAAACSTAPGASGSPKPACVATAGDRSQGAEYVPADASWQAKMGPGKELKPTAETIAAGAKGQKLTVSGTVLDARCRPLAGAAVDAWQVTADGAYGPGDGAGGLRCCYLTAQVRTDSNGRYELQTVMPGSYSGAPAHIHLGITGRGGGRLLTEIQFGGGELNLVRPITDLDGGLRVVFDIVLDTA